MENLPLSVIDKWDKLFCFMRTNQIVWSRVIFTGQTKIGGIRVWGSISVYGPCRIRHFDHQLTSPQYVSILEEIVLPMQNRNENLIFMQVR